MKIIALADVHGLLPQLHFQGIDCVMIAGDVCPVINHSMDFQKRWLKNTFYPWVHSMPVPVYFTLGNHDFSRYFKAPPNLIYGTQKVENDVLLFSWVPAALKWPWTAKESEIASRLNAVLRRLSPSFWLLHGPPAGVCDEVRDEHCGSTAIRSAILRYQPRLVICGHIHDGAREGKIGNSRILNVSIMNDNYIQVRDPVVIDII